VGPAADWDKPDRHTTRVERHPHGAAFDRRLDDTRYLASATWSGAGALVAVGDHEFEVSAAGDDVIDLAVGFSRSEIVASSFAETARAAETHWTRFWVDGAALDLSDSVDSRALELERRVVLSQFITAVNCAGAMPPQETGLVTNSWYGKHQLEMHW
jgi:hypothetical protein